MLPWEYPSTKFNTFTSLKDLSASEFHHNFTSRFKSKRTDICLPMLIAIQVAKYLWINSSINQKNINSSTANTNDVDINGEQQVEITTNTSYSFANLREHNQMDKEVGRKKSFISLASTTSLSLKNLIIEMLPYTSIHRCSVHINTVACTVASEDWRNFVRNYEMFITLSTRDEQMLKFTVSGVVVIDGHGGVGDTGEGSGLSQQASELQRKFISSNTMSNSYIDIYIREVILLFQSLNIQICFCTTSSQYIIDALNSIGISMFNISSNIIKAISQLANASLVNDLLDVTTELEQH